MPVRVKKMRKKDLEPLSALQVDRAARACAVMPAEPHARGWDAGVKGGGRLIITTHGGPGGPAPMNIAISGRG
jgi:hypothetical protein